MIMKRILILIIGLIGVAYGQSNPTSAKTRFVNGIYLGTKLDSYFAAADSNAIYWRADSVVMAKYKGTARALAFKSEIAGNTGILWGDGTNVNGSLYTFANDSVITFRGVKFLQNVSTSQFPTIYSTFVGYGAGAEFKNGTAGYANTGIGYFSLGGIKSNVNSEASSNTAVGYFSGSALTTGTSNTAIGTAALGSANSSKAVAIGWHSMEQATQGDNAVAIGSLSLQKNTANSEHVALGANTLTNNTTGLRNTAIGYNAINANTTGSYNTALGWDAMGDDAVGDYNTVLGYNAGNSLFAGSNNTIIGARVSPGSVNNSIAIGNGLGTVKAFHNNSSWDLYDTVKANRFVASGLTANDFLLGNGGSTTDVVTVSTNQTISGSKTFSSQITSTRASEAIISNSAASTSRKYFEVVSTGAQLYMGIENSAGGGLYTNSLPYSSVFGTANSTAVHLATNGVVRFSVAATGAASTTVSMATPKIIGSSATPSISGGSATYIGTGASTSVSGNDMAGVITLVTGTGCSSTGASNQSALTVTFASAYSTAPIVQIQAIQQGGLSSTDGPSSNFFLRRDAVGTGSFIVYLPIGVTLTDSTTYLITYQVIGR